MQSKNQVVILGISIFEKPEQTIQSNRSADRVRKKRPPSYFAVAALTSNLALYFYHAVKCLGGNGKMYSRPFFSKVERSTKFCFVARRG